MDNLDFYKKQFASKRFEIQENTIYLISSPLDFFDTMLNVIEEIVKKKSLAICYEFDENLIGLSKQNSIKIPSGAIFIPHTSLVDIKQHLIDNVIFSYKYAILISSGVNFSKNRITNAELLDFVSQKTVSFWQNKGTIMKFGALWVRNILHNMHHKTLDISSLKVCNMTTIVIGAGASISCQVDFIKQNREKLYIICVDTALIILNKYNITADLCIVLESQFANSYDFIGANNYSAVALDLTSYHVLFRKFISSKKPIYTFVTDFYSSVFLKNLVSNLKITKVPRLGNVGALSMYIASLVSDSNVLVLGIDYSYRALSHHKYSIFMSNKLSQRDRFLSIMTFGDSDFLTKDFRNVDVVTSKVMLSYLPATVSIFELETLKGRVFDARNSGLDFKIPQYTYPKLETGYIKNENKTINNDYLLQIRHEIFEVKNEIVEYINSSGNDISKGEKLMDTISGNMNILCFYFPDNVSLNRSYLKRLIITCDYYLNIINKIIN